MLTSLIADRDKFNNKKRLGADSGTDNGGGSSSQQSQKQSEEGGILNQSSSSDSNFSAEDNSISPKRHKKGHKDQSQS